MMDLRSRVRPGDEILVPERGRVRRNSGLLVAALITAAVSAVVTLATR